MSTSHDTTDPTDEDYRRAVLEEHRELFETIRDSEEISPGVRRKFGQRPLDVLAELQEETDE